MNTTQTTTTILIIQSRICLELAIPKKTDLQIIVILVLDSLLYTEMKIAGSQIRETSEMVTDLLLGTTQNDLRSDEIEMKRRKNTALVTTT